MQCYKCDNFLTSGDTCEFCGADVRYYKKIVYTSNALYNVALEKAQARDLSGAINYLHQSLKLNKKNINARNLLGLIYYEVGEVLEALAHWVISKNYQEKDNIAEKYINAVQNNQARLETVNQTIRKYNKALEYVQQKNNDLAIIQLKKVLSITPSFVKGNQLLALLYMKEGDYQKARRAIINALKIDNSNTRSIKYLEEIRSKLQEEEDKTSPQEKKVKNALDAPRKALSGNDVIIPNYSYKEYNSTTKTIINIIIGIVIGAVIILFLVTPAKTASVRSEYKEVILDYETKITALETQISQLEADVETYKGENIEGKYKSTISDLENLIVAEQAYNARDYVKAADAIGAIQTLEGKSEAFMNSYNKIGSECIAIALPKAVESAWNAYNAKDYDVAIENFTRCVAYDKTNPEYLFNLATSYEAKGEIDKAKEVYKQVVEKFPNTTQATQAQAKIG